MNKTTPFTRQQLEHQQAEGTSKLLCGIENGRNRDELCGTLEFFNL